MWVRPTQAPDDDVQVFYLGNRASVSHVGAVLGERYELLKVLGLGGTAAVYRALDKRTKATVAVKVLHAGAQEAGGDSSRTPSPSGACQDHPSPPNLCSSAIASAITTASEAANRTVLIRPRQSVIGFS